MAADRTRLRAAALAAAYGQRPGSPPRAVTEALTTTAPPPRWRRAGTSARSPRTTARRLTSRHSSKRARSSVSRGPDTLRPAFRKAASRPPNRSCAAATAASLVASSVTSPATAHVLRLSSQSIDSAERSTATTRPPMRVRCSTVARPIPDAAPVTTVTVSAGMSSPHRCPHGLLSREGLLGC
jgi:hypothetical protein